MHFLLFFHVHLISKCSVCSPACRSDCLHVFPAWIVDVRKSSEKVGAG